MFLAQISDTHLLPLAGNDAVACKRADNLERCVNTINQLPHQPEAVVHTGDMINFGADNDYGLAFEILSQLKAPFFPTVGNRDSRPHFIKQFLAPKILPENAPFCQYRIRLENFDIVCADSKSQTRNVGTSCTARLDQLQALLLEERNRPVFVFMHHPPARVEALRNPLQYDAPENAQAFRELFDRFDNIVRILCGHTHRSDIFPMGRHQASTLPSLATDVRLDHYPPRLAGEPLFQLHELHSDGHVTSTSHFTLASRSKTCPARGSAPSFA